MCVRAAGWAPSAGSFRRRTAQPCSAVAVLWREWLWKCGPNSTAQGLQALQNGLAADHLQVLLVNSDLLDRREDIFGAVAASELQTPVLMDTTQIIGESLGLKPRELRGGDQKGKG